MVIQNSEVSMASKGSYSATTKVTCQVTKEPAIQMDDITFQAPWESSLNYAMGQNGEVKTVGEEAPVESTASNRMARLQTMQYLIRVFLISRILGENKSFSEILNEMFASNAGMLTTTKVNYEYTESQELSYMAKGTAVTADGRKIAFDYGFEMSQSFHEEYESIQSSFSKFIDPLVINLTDSPTKIANQTFYFDLDADGTKDEINMLESTSGFLALDKNEDGEINDGRELFGVSTGDGFSELAVFDEDCNGWIDENDPVFEKLRVWSLNEKGDMELYTLKESDVGAIYLGRIKTEFINHDDEHRARAAIRESGVFLHESDGHAGSVQHVDFAT